VLHDLTSTRWRGQSGHLAGFAAMIAVHDLFVVRLRENSSALAVLKGLSHLAPAHVLRLKNEDFSRDPAVVQSMNEDPLLANEVQPTKTVAALVRADEGAPIFPAQYGAGV
jgi:alpha-beta hydrolase superfamily lysophospholipase